MDVMNEDRRSRIDSSGPDRLHSLDMAVAARSLVPSGTLIIRCPRGVRPSGMAIEIAGGPAGDSAAPSCSSMRPLIAT